MTEQDREAIRREAQELLQTLAAGRQPAQIHWKPGNGPSTTRLTWRGHARVKLRERFLDDRQEALFFTAHEPGHIVLGHNRRITYLVNVLLSLPPALIAYYLASQSTPGIAARFFKPLRQVIESVNDTLKGQLDLEQHGGRTIAGVCARVAQRVLAMTAAIWHNDQIGARIRRSLTAYDH